MMMSSGAWSLEISHNRLASIPSLAFSGLERALWRLVLAHNQFSRVPSDSIARLEKLNHLDLSGNKHFPDNDGPRTHKVCPLPTNRLGNLDYRKLLLESNFPMAAASFVSNKYSNQFNGKMS